MTALIIATLLAQAPEVEAQAPESAARAPQELFWLQLQYAMALHRGAQDDLGPGLRFSGFTPNDLSASAGFFFGGFAGAVASFRREGFSITRPDGARVSGSDLRVFVAPAGRLTLGPLRFELAAGYGFAALPFFGATADIAFTPAVRHSLLIAARGRLSLPLGLFAEARGEVPIALATSVGGGRGGSSGYGVGGSVGLDLPTSGRVTCGAQLDFQFLSDQLRPEGGATYSQSIARFGASARLGVLDAPPPPRYGDLKIRVVDEKTQQPIALARVTLNGREVLTSAADGVASAVDLRPGAVAISAAAGGYLEGEVEARITAGRSTDLVLLLQREPPKVGSVRVTVLERETGAPMRDVPVTIAGAQHRSDEQGQVRLEALPLGLVQISATQAGYKNAEEIAQIALGQESAVTLKLSPAKARVPGVIRGQIRSTLKKRPVAALLRIPQAQLEVRADADGQFSVRIAPGAYQVIISSPGYAAQTRQVTLHDGDRVIFNVDLQPERP